MSLFQNPKTSFDPMTRLPEIHRSRPILKRARTPYCPSTDPKRRRTSPTGAFARLSLSPSSSRSSSSVLQAGLSSPDSSPSLSFHNDSSSPIANHPGSFKNNTYHQSSFHSNDLNQFNHSNCFVDSLPTNNFNPIINSANPQKEVKMRSGYSAYEIEPNRIFIESLSDGSSSPTPSIQLEDEPIESHKKINHGHNSTSTLEIDPQIVKRISDHRRGGVADQSTRMILNSHQFILDYQPNLDQQLVLYRKPMWPSIKCLNHSKDHLNDDVRFQEISDDEDEDAHPITSTPAINLDHVDSHDLQSSVIELEPSNFNDDDNLSVEVLDSDSDPLHQPSNLHNFINPSTSFSFTPQNSVDSMEID